MESYPLVLIPKDFVGANLFQSSLQEFISFHNLKISTKPRPVFPPVKPEIKSTKLKWRVSLKKNAGCISIIYLLGTPVIALFIFLYKELTAKELISFVFFEFFFIAFTLEITKKAIETNLPRKDYQKLLDNYGIKMVEYRRLLKIYENDLFNYEVQKEWLEKKYDTENVCSKEKIYFTKLQPSLKPSQFPYKNRGKHDLFLEIALKNYFANSIFVDLVPNELDYPYQPDIVFIDEETGLHIDIEIDEPYNLFDREPIHCIDCEDVQRDDYFIRLNWVVIRFSENQVVNFTKDCCEYVKSVVSKVKYGSPIVDTTLSKEKRWTKQEAQVMSQNYYRERYFKDIKYQYFKLTTITPQS